MPVANAGIEPTAIHFADDGLVAAIEQCGAVLAKHFPLPPGSVNPDELPDKLVEI
jgi:uncharacterized membrane protein